MLRLLVYVTGDRIGDALIKLPVILTLRSAFPRHHITWLAGKRGSVFKDVLNPLVADHLDEIRDHARVGQRVSELFRSPLPGEYYDTIIDTEQKLRGTLALKRIPHRCLVSACAQFWLSDRKPAPGAARPVSQRARFQQLVNLACDKELISRTDWAPPEEHQAEAARLLPDGPSYLGFAPGASVAAKRWPLAKFIALARSDVMRRHTPVFFLGPGEAMWREQIMATLPWALCPEQEARGGPLLAVALAARLRAGIANDSGTGHILAAGGIPVVTLFGRASATKFTDEKEHRYVINARDHGRPQMDAIPIAAAEQLLQAALSDVGA